MQLIFLKLDFPDSSYGWQRKVNMERNCSPITIRPTPSHSHTLTWSQQSTSAAITSEWAFILVLTTVQYPRLAFTVPGLVTGVDGLLGNGEGFIGGGGSDNRENESH